MRPGEKLKLSKFILISNWKTAFHL